MAEQTEFGRWLAKAIRTHVPAIKREDLASALGVDATTISRWIIKAHQPKHEYMKPLADFFDEDYNFVLKLARYDPVDSPAAEPPDPRVERIVVELAKMLADDSPLSRAEQEKIRIVVDAGISPYRPMMRSKRRTG